MDLADIFERPFKYFPNKLAVVNTETDHKMNWKEFYYESVRLALTLRSMGVKKGDRVGILSMNRVRYLILYCANALLRSIIVPINFRLAPNELKFIIEDSSLSVILIGEECHDTFNNCNLTNKPKSIIISKDEDENDDYSIKTIKIEMQEILNFKKERIDENDIYGVHS